MNKKDPRSEMNFEQKFIWKDITKVMIQLKTYDLTDLSPVINSNNIIQWFIDDADSNWTFKWQSISSFWLEQKDWIWIYNM